jgi:hypothetical protein
VQVEFPYYCDPCNDEQIIDMFHNGRQMMKYLLNYVCVCVYIYIYIYIYIYAASYVTQYFLQYAVALNEPLSGR